MEEARFLKWAFSTSALAFALRFLILFGVAEWAVTVALVSEGLAPAGEFLFISMP